MTGSSGVTHAPDKSVEKVVAVPQEVLLKMNVKCVFVAAPDLA